MHTSTFAFAFTSAFAFASFFALTGCSATTEIEADATVESTATLTPMGDVIVMPVVKSRRLVRTKDSTCASVHGAGGSWSGAPVASAPLSSDDFCAYVWITAVKAEPDLAKLDEVAMYDEQLCGPYNVPDPRASNGAAPEVMVMQLVTFVGRPGDIWIGNDPTPRSSGCDVCVSWEGDHLWFVLPPQALSQSLYMKSGSTTYALGKAPGPVFYANVPNAFDGTPGLTW